MSCPPTRPSGECARTVSSFLKTTEGVTLTPCNLASSLSLLHTLVQKSELKRVERLASRISNIKLCHKVFQITLFTIYLFKKKCKRYSNSTQFKFFFSSLKFPKKEFQRQETLWRKAALPRGSEGARQSLSLELVQNHSCKDIQMWKILALSSLEAK